MQNEGAEGLSVEEADNEMFVELEADELDSQRSLLHDAADLVPVCGDTTVSEITCDLFENTTAAVTEANISDSSSSTIGYNDDDTQNVSGSVQHDHTLSDVETSATGLDESITTHNINEEGGTSSQTTTSNGDDHLCSGDERVLPVHSVPIVMEIETTGGQADDISSATESSVVSDVIPSSSGLKTSCCYDEVQSLATSETTCTITDTETSGAEPSESVVHCGHNRSSTILSCTSVSDIGVHMVSDDENFAEVSHAESVNLQNISMYSSLKFPHIVLTPVDAVDLSSSCVKTSSDATFSLPETSKAASLMPSAEEPHNLEVSITADTPCTVTSAKEDSVHDEVSTVDDTVAVVDNSQASDDSVSPAAEFAVIDSVGADDNPPAADVVTTEAHLVDVESSVNDAKAVGLKRAHDDDSVEGFAPKQQKTEDNSLSLSQHTNDDVSDAHWYVDVSQSPAEHSMSTDASASTVVFNVEAVEQTDIDDSQQEAMCLPTDSNISVAEDVTTEQLVLDQVWSVIDSVGADDNPPALDVVTTEAHLVDVESSVNDAKAVNDNALVPDGADVLSSNAPIGESGLYAMKKSELLNTDVLAGKISGVPGASRALILPPPPTVTKNAGSKMRMRMEAANKDKLPASASMKKYQKNRSATIAPKATSVRTSDAEQTTAVSNKEVEISVPASEIGPSVDDKASCELSESVTASAAAKTFQQNRSETIAAKETSVGTEQTAAVSDKEAEISIPSHEICSSVDDKPSSELSESQEQGQSSDESKAEPLLEWRSPPTKSTALKDDVMREGGVVSNEKLSSQQYCDEDGNQKQSELDAGGKKVKPLMDWQPPVSWNSPYHPSSPTDSASVIEWKPAPSCRPKSAPLGKEAEIIIEPRISPVRFQSEYAPFHPPQNVTHDQILGVPALSQQPLPVIAQPPPGQMPMLQPSIIVSTCNAQLPNASLAPVMPGNAEQPVLPYNVISNQISGGQVVQMNSGQPPLQVGLVCAPAVQPPVPVLPSMLSPPPLSCQVPPPMLETVPGGSIQPAPPGVVVPIVFSDQTQTAPRVMPADHQPPPAFYSPPPQSVVPVPAPNVSPQSQVGPSLGQPAPPGVVLPVAQAPSQMAPAVPHSKPPWLSSPMELMQGLLPTPTSYTTPSGVGFGSSHSPHPSILPTPQPVPPPQSLPSTRPPAEHFHPPHGHVPPVMGPPPHAPPRWGPFQSPHAGPPMRGPHQGIPPQGFNRPYPAMHGPAVPPAWHPPPMNPPGGPYMQPGLHNVNWRPPMPDGGWWGAPPPADVSQWGLPHGQPDLSYSGRSESGTSSEFLNPGSNSQTGGDDAETASLTQAAREWAEWQQRYSEWYCKYYGYSGSGEPAPDAFSVAKNTIVTTPVPTKASLSEKRVSNTSSSAPATKASSFRSRTFATASSVSTKSSFTERSVSKNAAIPLPSGQPVAKPGTADAFAKFAEHAASNINLALGMSSNKPAQNTANEPVSSTTNVSSTSVKPSEGE